MVVNGATKFGDMEHFNKHLEAFRKEGGDVSFEYFHSRNLVALQGPASPAVLARLVSAEDANVVTTMPFMSGRPYVPPCHPAARGPAVPARCVDRPPPRCCTCALQHEGEQRGLYRDALRLHG